MNQSYCRTVISCFWLILAGFFSLTSLSCTVSSYDAPVSRNGILDCTSTDLSRTPVSLSGEWEFFWMKFISASAKNTSNDTPDALIHVPGAWNGTELGKETVTNQGYASYRLKILTKEKGLLGFSVPDMSSAYKLWVNGELISSCGTPGNSPRESSPASLYRTVYFYSDGNPLTITVHVSNFNHAYSGMWKPIVFGGSTAIHKVLNRSATASILTTSGLIVLAISFLIFHLIRKIERFTLILVIICVAVALRTIFDSSSISSGNDPVLPWWFSIKFKYIASIALAFLFKNYMHKLFSEEVIGRRILFSKAISWTSIFLCIFVLLAPVTIFTGLMALYISFFVMVTIFSSSLIMGAIKKKQRGAIPLGSAFAVIIITVINDLLYNFNIVDTGEYTPAAILVFAATQSMIIAHNYSNAYKNVEVLSNQLKANNTMIKKLNEQIDHKNREMTQRLYTDRLTELPNRQSLFVDIHATSFPSLMLIDIDAFKEINDFYGNRIGDFVLKEAAINIDKIINPDTCKLYKLSVDEYAVLIDDESVDQRSLSYQANTLCQETSRRPIIHGKNEIFIRITIGAALGSKIEGRKTFEDIIVRADMALKQAKRFAKPFLLYNDSMEIIKEYEKNMHWARKLKLAVETDRIIPYYQPIINTTTGAIEKFECLIRLTDDDGSIISPFHFLDIARKCRLYTELTKIMIDKSFNAFSKSKYEFSINIAMDDILDTETREYILGVLMINKDIAPRAIFEILESQDIENYSEVREFLSQIKSFGCRIAVDDFGSGYSNFEHIMKLNIDFIKIDSSLVKNIHVDRNSRVIVKTISVFAKELGIKTVAEFVHCEEVLEHIRAIGIDYAQGYHLGEPKSSIA